MKKVRHFTLMIFDKFKSIHLKRSWTEFFKTNLALIKCITSIALIGYRFNSANETILNGPEFENRIKGSEKVRYLKTNRVKC